MVWHAEPPTNRVFALVLAHGSRVPDVGQYEPRLDSWHFDNGVSLRMSQVEWHPLPYHTAFNKRTHALEG